MTQSQQSSERTFIAVDFRGVQQASRERTSLGVAGGAGLAVASGLPAPLGEPVEREPDADPRPQSLRATGITLELGGEGARAAYAYAALGGLVRLAATLGEDPAGDVVLRWLEGRGAGVEAVRRSGQTPVTVYVDAPGVQPLLLASGESPGPEPDAAGSVLGDRGSALLLAGYPYVGPLRGQEGASLLAAARRRGVRTVLSLSPVALGGAGSPLVPADLELLLPHADLVCGGPAELRRATRRGDPLEAARVLIGAGAKAVLTRRGPDGASLFRLGAASLDREDTFTPTAVAALNDAGLPPYRVAVAFGAAYDAAYLLGEALNDASPARFAAAAAVRAARAPAGVLGI
jgi:sugar/nucleoside kinase (ribokinase family)